MTNDKNWLTSSPVEWKPADGEPDFKRDKVFRFSCDYDSKPAVVEILDAFFSYPGTVEVTGIVIGMDMLFTYEGNSKPIVDSLAENSAKLPNLRGIYLGDIEPDQYEISWIKNSNVGPLLTAFPGLEELHIRGGNGLDWESCRHICLKKLVVETGGLNKSFLAGVANSVLPELEHLELWLGTDEYGWNGTAEDVKPFLYQNPFPNLQHLALKNCDHQTEIAVLAADAPVLDQLESLDLSCGILRDEGGEALLRSEKVKLLNKLDLSHHFMSDDIVGQFQASDLNVDVSEQLVPDDWGGGELYYYVSVSE